MNKNGSVGFAGLLAILFIGLKLGGVISWSWWWVLSPLWMPFAFLIGVAIFAFGLAGVLDHLSKR